MGANEILALITVICLSVILTKLSNALKESPSNDYNTLKENK